MFGKLRSVVGVGLLAVAGGVACTPGGSEVSGSVEDPAGAGAVGPSDPSSDPSYKVADVIMRTATAMAARARASQSKAALPEPASSFAMHVGSGSLEVTLHVGHVLTQGERSALAGLGAQVGEVAVAPDRTSRADAWVPAGALMSLAALDFVAAITPPEYGVVNQAAVNPIQSEGVHLHHADTAHANGVTGKGV